MNTARRISYFLLAAVAVMGPACAADTWPTHAVRVVVGFAPGGATDQLARLYAARLTTRLGQSFVVENRPGAGGDAAIQGLTQDKPDGYTIAMAANYIAINAALHRSHYDWTKDIAPVALVASTPNLLVVPASSRITSVRDLIAAVKKGPPVTFGSPGVASTVDMAGELFKVMTDGQMTHVPYRGVTPAEVDLIAGQIDIMFDSISTAAPLAKGGKLRALAVTGKTRAKSFPDLPTLEEAGLPGFDVEATYLVVAPAKTPPEVIDRLSAAIAEISKQPDVQRIIESLYARGLAGGPAESRAFLTAETQKWEQVAKTTGVSTQ